MKEKQCQLLIFALALSFTSFWICFPIWIWGLNSESQERNVVEEHGVFSGKCAVKSLHSE